MFLQMNDSERLITLKEFNILDTLPEVDFDDIAELASVLCGTPVSMISSLDTHRQWYKAKTGISDNESPIEYFF